MKSILRYMLCVISMLAFMSCDVHEFPSNDQRRIPFDLDLHFNTDLPIHTEITHTKGSETKASYETHDVRYVINAYRTDLKRSTNRIADTSFVFTKDCDGTLDYKAHLALPEGSYDFNVWVDYVDDGSKRDKYYDTRDFSEIILANKGQHSGSNEYREAFRGYSNGVVMDPLHYSGQIVNEIHNESSVEMMRPMGKFKFISTDVEAFLTKVMATLKEQGKLNNIDTDITSKSGYEQLKSVIELDKYRVVFRYNLFMPCSFNMFTDKPADSWTGVTFNSPILLEDDFDGMVLGHDFVFVNGSTTTLSISLEVYNNEGQKISSTNPINVPVVRNKLTLVKGEFLTSIASGGISINPGYDGEDYNIEIK